MYLFVPISKCSAKIFFSHSTTFSNGGNSVKCIKICKFTLSLSKKIILLLLSSLSSSIFFLFFLQAHHCNAKNGTSEVNFKWIALWHGTFLFQRKEKMIKKWKYSGMQKNWAKVRWQKKEETNIVYVTKEYYFFILDFKNYKWKHLLNHSFFLSSNTHTPSVSHTQHQEQKKTIHSFHSVMWEHPHTILQSDWMEKNSELMLTDLRIICSVSLITKMCGFIWSSSLQFTQNEWEKNQQQQDKHSFFLWHTNILICHISFLHNKFRNASYVSRAWDRVMQMDKM